MDRMRVIEPPAGLAGVLRQWLTEWPDKVLFGSDGFDGGVEGKPCAALLDAARVGRIAALGLQIAMTMYAHSASSPEIPDG